MYCLDILNGIYKYLLDQKKVANDVSLLEETVTNSIGKHSGFFQGVSTSTSDKFKFSFWNLS